LMIRQHGRVPRTAVRGGSIADAVEGFGKSLTINPWLKYYPVLLDDVYVARFGKGWTLREADGPFLPIAASFQYKWVMHGLHGGQPQQVAALWDGRALFPMSVINPTSVTNLYQTMSYLP